MADSTLPPILSVRRFFADLLCRQVDVEKDSGPTPQAPVAVAAYKTSDGSVGAVWVFDLEMANYAGASLSMMPAGLARESVRSREVPELIEENLLEICNIGARLFDHPEHPNVRFDQAFLPQEDLPETISTHLNGQDRVDLKVAIKGYGAGRMSLVRAA